MNAYLSSFANFRFEKAHISREYQDALKPVTICVLRCRFVCCSELA